MAKLVFGMNQSLDGYVDPKAVVPSATLFRHFIEEARRQTGRVYGRLALVGIGQSRHYFAGPRPLTLPASGPHPRTAGHARNGLPRTGKAPS